MMDSAHVHRLFNSFTMNVMGTSCLHMKSHCQRHIKQHRVLQVSFQEAVAALQQSVAGLPDRAARHAASGMLRVEAPFPATFSALSWLMAQPQNSPVEAGLRGIRRPQSRHSNVPPAASVYFSPRSAPHPAADAQQSSTATVAGVHSQLVDIVTLCAISWHSTWYVHACGKHHAQAAAICPAGKYLFCSRFELQTMLVVQVLGQHGHGVVHPLRS